MELEGKYKSSSIGSSLENEIKEINKVPLETHNKIILKICKYLGLYLVEWNSTSKQYFVLKIRFIIYYSFWFLWPSFGLALALFGWEIFNLNNQVDDVNNALETTLFLLGFALVPSLQVYCLKKITENLPTLLEKIAVLNGKVAPKFKYKFKLHKILPKLDNYSQSSDQAFFYLMPVITLMLAVTVFITASVFSIIDTVEWTFVKQEWPFYVMQYTYLVLPVITIWFSLIFVTWFKCIYKYFTKEILTLDSKEKADIIDECVDLCQDIFEIYNTRFMQYTSSINFIVITFSSIYCTMKLLLGFHEIMYLLPLLVGFGHLWLSCYSSTALIDQFVLFQNNLRSRLKLLRKENSPVLQDVITSLYETSQNNPPQLMIYGDYSINLSLFVGTVGFSASYAVLFNEILAPDPTSVCYCNLNNSVVM